MPLVRKDGGTTTIQSKTGGGLVPRSETSKSRQVQFIPVDSNISVSSILKEKFVTPIQRRVEQKLHLGEPMKFQVGENVAMATKPSEVLDLGLGPIRPEIGGEIRARQTLAKLPLVPERGNPAKTVLEATQQVLRRVPQAALTAFSGGKERQFDIPNNPLARLFLGEEPIKTIPSEIKGGAEMISQFAGAQPGENPSVFEYGLGGVGVAGLISLDLVLGGGGSTAKNVAKNVLKYIEERYGKTVARELTEQIGKDALEQFGKKTSREISQEVIDRFRSKYVKKAESGIAPYTEKNGKNLIEFEYSELTTPELKRKIAIALERKDYDVAKIAEKDLAERLSRKRSPSAAKILGEEQPRNVVKREDVLLRDRLRAEARGAKQAAGVTRRITKEELVSAFKASQVKAAKTRKMLSNYIQAQLPQESRGKFLNAISDVGTSSRKQASIFTRVEQEKERLTRRELIQTIKDEVRKPTKQVNVEYQKRILELTNDINLAKPSKKTVGKLQSLVDYIKRTGDEINIPASKIKEIERLSKTNVADMTTEELKNLKNQLESLRSLGQLKQKLVYKYNARERDVALNKLLNSTRNIDPKTSGKGTKLDSFKVGTKQAYMDTMHTFRVADMLDGYKGYSGENAKIIKTMGETENVAKIDTSDTIDEFLNKVKELGFDELTEEQEARIMINIRYREKAFDAVNKLMDVYKFDEVPKLTPQERELIDLIKSTKQKKFDELGVSAIYEELNNEPFQFMDNHIMTLRYEKEINVVPSEMISQTRHRTTKVEQGFTRVRQQGVKKTPRIDLLGMFEEDINDLTWYGYMQPVLENYRHLVLSPEYLEKGGEMAVNFWKNQLDTVARRGWSATAKSNPVLRQARLNINKAILGYKVSSIAMQPFAIFDALAYVESKFGGRAAAGVFGEFSKSWINPKYAKEVISKSKALRLREAGELAIEETLKNLAGKQSKWSKFVEGSMKLIQKADVKTAAGVDEAVFKILEKQGVKNAREEADFIMNLVSGSADVSFRPHILSKGEGARTWFTFQTFFLNRWGLIWHDLINGGLLKSKGYKKKLTALIGLGILTAGGVAEEWSRRNLYEFTTGKELPDEPLALKAISMIPENVPFFGNFLSFGSSSPPVVRTLENLYSGSKSLITSEKESAKVRGGLRAAESLLTLGAGFPGTAQGFDILERILVPEDTKKKEGILPEVGGGLPSLPKLPSLKK